jgi:hypothetical protein
MVEKNAGKEKPKEKRKTERSVDQQKSVRMSLEKNKKV